MEISLDGKVALVTGAGPNIGSGIALALAAYGAKVTCNDLRLDAAKGAPGVIAYAFHKGGLANFVRAAAMDLAPYGIRVNSFSPTARLITGCDFTVDGGARAKYWGYTPPADNAGPIPLIPIDVTGRETGSG